MQRGDSSSIHWKYAIVVTKCLRSLLRRDVPTEPSHVDYMLERTYDSHPSIVRFFFTTRQRLLTVEIEICRWNSWFRKA